MTAILALILLVPSARAAEGGSPCAGDVALVCSKTSPGPERWKCLHANEAKLSPACRQRITEMRARGQEFREACKAEIGGACLNLERRALIECLEAQGDKLSPACADKVKAIARDHKAEHELIAAACKDDAQKQCKGVASGDGRIAACLKAHRDRLSKECAETLK